MRNENLAAEAVTSMVLALAAEAADHGKTVSAQSVLRDLGLDYLDAVELVMAIEDELGGEINVGEYDDNPEGFLSLPLQTLIDATLEAMKRRAQDLGAASAVAALCEAAGVDLSGVDLGAAVPGQCQGTSCAASASNGYDHSPECIVEAAEAQGWADAPEAVEARAKIVPKLTPANIEAVIVGEHFFTASHGIDGAYVPHLSPRIPEGMERVTFCVLTLRNGTKVTGVNHGPVSAANFDAAIGRQYARANAVEKVWELEGYLLRERLSAPTLTLNLSESQQAELLEQIRNAPPGTLVMQATDGGPNQSYSPEHDAAFAALELVRAFVAKHRISCPETIHQTDRVIEEAYGFIQDLVDVAGYHRDHDDAADGEVQP